MLKKLKIVEIQLKLRRKLIGNQVCQRKLEHNPKSSENNLKYNSKKEMGRMGATKQPVR